MRKILLLASALFTMNSHAQMTVTVGSTVLDVDTIYFGTGSSGAYTGTNGMDIPWEVIYGSDDHLWVTERKGLISRINPVTKTKTIVLNIISNVYQQSESGLLGMVLHPDFETTPEVFLAYTYGTFSNIKEKVVKYTYNGTTLVNEVILIDNIIGNTTHNGSRIAILADNTLIFSTGDAQNTSLPQDTDAINGKILRVNLDGTIPANNPIPDNPVYSWGHRNVQGILQHPNGKVYLSEHGASTDDEFQLLEVGRNYGWPNVEGFCDPGGEETFCIANNVIEPLVSWTPTIAPSDMVYYENSFIPEWDGRVLMSVLKDKKLIAMQLNTDGTSVIDEDHYLTNTFGRLRDICVGPEKEIYLATNGASWSNTNPNTHLIIMLRPQDNSGLNETFSGKLNIYPNPVGTEFSVEVTENMIGKDYIIYDVTGRVVLKGTLQSLTQQIDATVLNKGIYDFTVLGSNGGLISKKLVK